MKKIMFLFVLLTLGWGSMNAQDRDQDQLRDRDQDRLMMVDGDLLRIRDRDQVRLNDELLLADGTVVQPNGAYTNPDGKRLRLRDGECLDMDGIHYRNEYQYRYKVQKENEGLTEAQIQNRNQNRWQLMLIDGQVYQVQNQMQERVRDQFVITFEGINDFTNGLFEFRGTLLVARQ